MTVETTTAIIIVLSSIYVMISIVIFGIGLNFNIWTPRSLYDKGLNWFGSYFLFILFLIFNPIYVLIVIFLYTIYAIRWCFTAGRK